MEETVVGGLSNNIKVHINKKVDKIFDFSSIFDELKKAYAIAKCTKPANRHVCNSRLCCKMD